MNVSIIICAYNEEEKIYRSIDSVRAQTHSDWELWIIDDGSTDNTAKIVERYKKTKDSLQPENRVLDAQRGNISPSSTQTTM